MPSQAEEQPVGHCAQDAFDQTNMLELQAVRLDQQAAQFERAAEEPTSEPPGAPYAMSSAPPPVSTGTHAALSAGNPALLAQLAARDAPSALRTLTSPWGYRHTRLQMPASTQRGAPRPAQLRARDAQDVPKAQGAMLADTSTGGPTADNGSCPAARTGV